MTIKDKERHARWKAKNREHYLEYQRCYRLKNLEKTTRRVTKWKRDNKERYRKCVRDWMRNKRSTDYSFRILGRLRGRIRDAIKGRRKSTSTVSLLGCHIKDFLMYLESKFETGMTWENYGKVWHLDHIMPCAIFDFSKPEHVARCFHFSNLQPMFALENLRKGSKVPTD